MRTDTIGILRSHTREISSELAAIVNLGQRMIGTKSCSICLVDDDFVWFTASVGADIDRVPRGGALCSDVIQRKDLLIREDLSQDAEFHPYPLKGSADGIQFYAGYPILMDGSAIGTICVFDPLPRSFSPENAKALEDLGLLAKSTLVAALAARNAGTDRAKTDGGGVPVDRRHNLILHTRIMDQAADVAKIGAWEVDLDSGALLWSEGMYRIHGISPETPITRDTPYDMYLEPYRSRIRRAAEKARINKTSFDVEGPALLPDGRVRWFRVAGSMHLEDGKPARWGGMKQDITEQKRLLHRVERLATIDPVTRLSSRSAFMAALKKDSSPGRSRALLLVGLDGFKRVNDTHGHEAGDACLRAVGSRIRRAVKDAAMVARLGGDEFAILTGGSGAGVDVEAIARRLLRDMRRPILWKDTPVHLGASIGIAVTSDNGCELHRRAQLALYAAKAAGRGTWRVFDPMMRAAAETRFRQIEDIHGALERCELEAFYQQKIAFSTGMHAGFEALVRWRHPDGTVAGPASFSAALEDGALSARIDDYMLERAIQQAASWKRDGLPFGHIAVNLSASQFLRDGLAERIDMLLRRHRMSPECIELEVTENVFLDAEPQKILQTLAALRASGIRLALDDFGTGFASLTHLSQFPVDVIKIDRSFVSKLSHSTKETAIVQSMVHLANSLGMEVVAEGIETDAEATFLKAVGCTYGQGYWYSHPSDAQNCTRLIKALDQLSA